MPNITLYVPEELYKKMKKYKEIKWSEVARQSIIEKIKQMEEMGMRKYSLKRIAEEEDELFEV